MTNNQIFFTFLIILGILNISFFAGTLFNDKNLSPNNENEIINYKSEINKLNNQLLNNTDSISFYKEKFAALNDSINNITGIKRKNNETTKQKVINIDKNNVDSNIAIFSNTAKEYNRK